MNGGGQMALPLQWRPSLGRADFLVADCNREALAALDAPQGWPGGRLALCGPPRSGKSHLAQVWRTASGAAEIAARELARSDIDALASGPLLVEDAERVAGDRAGEEALFHLVNLAQARGHALLLTGCGVPAGWGITLPDLASRLRATAIAPLALPDDALLSSVLVKLAADRRMALPPAVVQYIVTRMERSLAAAERIVGALDRTSMAQRRRISSAMAAEVLQADAAE